MCSQFISQFSHSVVSDSVWSHGLQHTRPPCPSPAPGAYSNSCLLSQWCHPTVSSYVVPFSSRLQSFPASGSFPMNQSFASGDPAAGKSADAIFPRSTNWSSQCLSAHIFWSMLLLPTISLLYTGRWAWANVPHQRLDQNAILASVTFQGQVYFCNKSCTEVYEWSGSWFPKVKKSVACGIQCFSFSFLPCIETSWNAPSISDPLWTTAAPLLYESNSNQRRKTLASTIKSMSETWWACQRPLRLAIRKGKWRLRGRGWSCHPQREFLQTSPLEPFNWSSQAHTGNITWLHLWNTLPAPHPLAMSQVAQPSWHTAWETSQSVDDTSHVVPWWKQKQHLPCSCHKPWAWPGCVTRTTQTLGAFFPSLINGRPGPAGIPGLLS